MFFWFIRTLAVPLARILFRTKVEGDEFIPQTGPVMIVGNHQSNLDPIFIACANPRRLYAMGKAELFVNPMSKWFYLHLGAYPIERGKPDRKGLKKIFELFYRGEAVIIFPEGGRNHNPGLGPMEPGVSFIADLIDPMILPVGITGSGRIWPKGNKLPRFPRVVVKYGRPFRISEEFPRVKSASAAEKKARQEAVLGYVSERIKQLSDDAY
jgi:1-acyl-sn-glycerol-3-phosphate acyltransferase